MIVCESSERDGVDLQYIHTSTINYEELQTFPHNKCVFGSVKITATFYVALLSLEMPLMLVDGGRRGEQKRIRTKFFTRALPSRHKPLQTLLCPGALVTQRRETEIPGNPRCPPRPREAALTCTRAGSGL